MKAIIVAAGLGSRMKSLTEGRPKCSLPINGLSIFDRQLRAFRAAGIEDISVVVGHSASFFGAYPDVKKYVNEDYRENNILMSLMSASAELESDVIVCYSDIIFGENLPRELLPLKADFTAVTDLDWRENYVGRSDHPESQAENVVVFDGMVRAIGKHLNADQSTGEFIGMFALSQDGCEIWKRTFKEVQVEFDRGPFHQAMTFKNAYLTDMIQELVDRGFPIKSHSIRGGWMEIDTAQDYAAAGQKFPA